MSETRRAADDTDGRRLVPPDAGIDSIDAAGLHIDLTSVDEATISDDGHAPDPVQRERYGSLETLMDAFVEAFNAHDLDRARELLAVDVELPGIGGDADGFVGVVTQCWEERPHAILTRGLLPDADAAWDGQPAAILWDVEAEGGWTRTGVLTFDAAGDEEIGLIEYVVDAAIIDEVEGDIPEPDLPEGASWREWDEGAEPV